MHQEADPADPQLLHGIVGQAASRKVLSGHDQSIGKATKPHPPTTPTPSTPLSPHHPPALHHAAHPLRPPPNPNFQRPPHRTTPRPPLTLPQHYPHPHPPPLSLLPLRPGNPPAPPLPRITPHTHPHPPPPRPPGLEPHPEAWMFHEAGFALRRLGAARGRAVATRIRQLLDAGQGEMEQHEDARWVVRGVTVAKKRWRFVEGTGAGRCILLEGCAKVWEDGRVCGI